MREVTVNIMRLIVKPSYLLAVEPLSEPSTGRRITWKVVVVSPSVTLFGYLLFSAPHLLFAVTGKEKKLYF